MTSDRLLPKNLLGCLDTPSEGSYRINGSDVRGLGDDEQVDIDVVFQTFQLMPPTTALASVELPLECRGLPRWERRERSARTLDLVELGNRKHHRPNELTGGQRQRAAIELQGRVHTIVLVTHEPRLAARCPRAIRLSDGKVVAEGSGHEASALDAVEARV